MHCTSKSVLSGLLTASAPRAIALPPPFLLPAFSSTQTATFSSSASALARKDANPSRGVSALRRTGLNKKQRLSVKLSNLPKPVLDPSKRSKVEIDEDHGLWGFFNAERTPLMKPEDYAAHGRAWTVSELRHKDWDDMHKLWWLCVKDKNRIKTYELERERLKAGYGEFEAQNRLTQIRLTMKAIKHTLTERWYAWENARELAMEDEEVDLFANPDNGQQAYFPKRDTDDVFSNQTQVPSSTGVQGQMPPPDATSPQTEARV